MGYECVQMEEEAEGGEKVPSYFHSVPWAVKTSENGDAFPARKIYREDVKKKSNNKWSTVPFSVSLSEFVLYFNPQRPVVVWKWADWATHHFCAALGRCLQFQSCHRLHYISSLCLPSQEIRMPPFPALLKLPTSLAGILSLTSFYGTALKPCSSPPPVLQHKNTWSTKPEDKSRTGYEAT